MSIIKIKRTGSAGKPGATTLATGEMAYVYNASAPGNEGQKLYIGSGDETTPGQAPNIVAIGGEFYTGMLDHTAGALTANSALIADSNSKINQIILGGTSATDTTATLSLTNRTLSLPANVPGQGQDPATPGFTISGGDIALSTQKITGLAAPTANSDAATKAYVDGVAGGMLIEDEDGTQGTIENGTHFIIDGTQSVTTSFDDATNTLSIGLQQEIGDSAEVAFASLTTGALGSQVKIAGDSLEQINPAIYLEINTETGGVITGSPAPHIFNVTGHGLDNNEQVIYESVVPFTNLTSGGTYFIDKVSDDAFKLRITSGANAITDFGTQGSTKDIIRSVSNPVDLFATSDTINLGSTAYSTVAVKDNLTVGGNTVIAGNLTVNGTSTTVNSTVVQVDDPVLELGTTTTDYDGLGRGIKFNYKEGSDKVGFFGYDVKNAADDAATTAGKFRFLTDATGVDSNGLTGTVGTIVANVEGAVTGNADTATQLAAAANIELTGAVTGNIDFLGNADIQIDTSLAQTVDSLLGEYVLDVTVPGTIADHDNDAGTDDTFLADPAGSSIIIGSANGQGATGQGDHVTVEVALATTQAAPPITDSNDVNYVNGWKSNRGVASFSSENFNIQDGWVSIDTVDGGTYGS